MEIHYLCPKCKSHLRVAENIILTFKCKKHDEKGIILLNSKLGNYSFTIRANATITLNTSQESYPYNTDVTLQNSYLKCYLE